MKILIVDDSNFSQKVESNLLQKYVKNADIHFASDGKEGLEKYKEIEPDYIFIDLLMPKMNGHEMIKLLKEYDNTAKIFVVSADVQKSVREEIEGYGIVSFINKPIDEEKAKLISYLIRNGGNE